MRLQSFGKWIFESLFLFLRHFWNYGKRIMKYRNGELDAKNIRIAGVNFEAERGLFDCLSTLFLKLRTRKIFFWRNVHIFLSNWSSKCSQFVLNYHDIFNRWKSTITPIHALLFLFFLWFGADSIFSTFEKRYCRYVRVCHFSGMNS